MNSAKISYPTDNNEKVCETGENLSIICHGPFLLKDIEALAHSFRHWRSLFPNCEIIAVISSSDFLDLDINSRGKIINIDVNNISNIDVALSIDIIKKHVDSIVLSEGEIAFSGIWQQHEIRNNINVQIAAAQTGMRYASRFFTLRTRNDFVFMNKKFMNTYNSSDTANRGEFSVFDRKIMIAEQFTINPYTFSHMPFHYSDWFHFGMTKDIRDLWDKVSFMNYPDSTYYKFNNFPSGTNIIEKKYIARFTPEQFIHYPYFSSRFPDLQMNFFNDMHSANESMRILADNFILANMAQCGAYIKKYQHAIQYPSRHTQLECLNQSLLDRIINNPDIPPSVLFSSLRSLAEKRLFWRYNNKTISIRKVEKIIKNVISWFFK